ncbi:MAG: substrate-binding domain-containing protein [Acidimicrobiia bacterium]|nr:substrate-binding domain-containing protein [Acidimicrobiia bacterium]
MRSTSFRRSWRLLALLLSLTLLAAACGDGADNESGDGSADAGNGGSEAVSGDIVITGSSTVEPISSLVAENFQADNPDVTPTVDGPGTGDGFELFCNGEADITDASRAIEAEEATACEESGVEFIELRVAFDGISVLTSPENDVTCLTFEDLYALVGPESEGVTNWSDAQALATELGSDTELPDAPLDITAPGEESGTYDSFIELALGDIAEARLESGDITEEQAETTRPDYTSSADDNIIIEGVGGSDSSLGWVGFAFAENAGDTVKELEVDGGDGCTAPSADSISDESYPLSRPLFIYVNSQNLESNAALRPFVEYYLSEDGLAAVEETGYVPLPDDQLTESASAFEDGTTGTREESE